MVSICRVFFNTESLNERAPQFKDWTTNTVFVTSASGMSHEMKVKSVVVGW